MTKTVAVFFGGRSAEHDVSIITAYIPIIQGLQAAGAYDVVPVYISKTGHWYSLPQMDSLSFFQQPNYQEILAAAKPLQAQIGGGLTLVWPEKFRSRAKIIDLAFPAMHGTYGEDGTLMGLLRLAGIPFVGCDLEASAIAMDKVLTKQVTEPLGIPSTPYIWFSAQDWQLGRADYLQRANRLKYPWFVKPVHLGSSIAITKVDQADQLENAIEVALHYDDKVIIEQGVANLIEVTLPIMGNDEPVPALVERPFATFFDFDEKYLKPGKSGKGGGKGANSGYSELPAKISDELTQRVLELGKQAYRAIGATGVCRIDFLIDGQTDAVYLNEINTLPGSLYHHNWRAAGVSSVDLIGRLIALAEDKFVHEQARQFIFNSTILRAVGGSKIQPPR